MYLVIRNLVLYIRNLLLVPRMFLLTRLHCKPRVLVVTHDVQINQLQLQSHIFTFFYSYLSHIVVSSVLPTKLYGPHYGMSMALGILHAQS